MISAVIPIRNHAQQEELIPRNGGVSWLENRLTELSGVDEISEIIVSTDSPMVLQELSSDSRVRVLDRQGVDPSLGFAGVVRHAAEFCREDTLGWFFANAISLSSDVVADMVSTYGKLDTRIHDCLVTCSSVREYFFDDNGPINFSIGHDHMERRDLFPIFQVENACFLMSKSLNLELCHPWGRVPFRYLLNQ